MGPVALQGTIAAILILQGIGVEAVCFFPPEYIGEFVMQKSVNTGNAVEYSTVNISATGTPLWGTCSKRYDNNFIFTISTNEYLCMGCLNLDLKSRNVLQVRATNLSKCYEREEDAKASCPTPQQTKEDNLLEIILFKTQDQNGYPTTKEFCPIDGRYSVVYRSSGLNRTHVHRCMLEETIIDMCPSAAEMNFKFEKCHEGFGFKLSCIGQWKGANGLQYLALEDTRQKTTYRCALFERDRATGVVKIALSKDSTCDNELESPTKGHETLVMRPAPREDLPWISETENEVCRFPTWMQGKWEHVTVDHNTFVYREQTNFVKYDLRCLAAESESKYVVHVRTQCGNEKSYSCLWAQQRDDNVFEFQFGNSSLRRGENLCHRKSFEQSEWITQGRERPVTDLRCPISGIFNGMIPEIGNFCSTLSSDCTTPDLMYYKIYDCTTLQMYEEREYRCLGNWREGDLLYTYTKRHDKVAEGTSECFVGTVSESEDFITIKEAGEHCKRKMEGVISMTLTKEKQLSKSCVEPSSDTISTHIQTSTISNRRPTNIHRTTQWTTGNYGKNIPTSQPPMQAGSSVNVVLHCLTVLSIFVMIVC